jgi:NADH dehydrogenase FAD-containing subunit
MGNTSSSMPPAHVVIIGGGYAAVALAQRLDKQRGVRVTILEVS